MSDPIQRYYFMGADPDTALATAKNPTVEEIVDARIKARPRPVVPDVIGPDATPEQVREFYRGIVEGQQARHVERDTFDATRTPLRRLLGADAAIASLPVRILTGGKYGLGDLVGVLPKYGPAVKNALARLEGDTYYANAGELNALASMGEAAAGIPPLVELGAVSGGIRSGLQGAVQSSKTAQRMNALARKVLPDATSATQMNIFAGPKAATADASALARAENMEKSVELPMDDASRLARAKEMGYSDDPFYRGEATGKAYEGGAAYFSRDREYSAGFAMKGGQAEPGEYRLNLQDAFMDQAPIDAGKYADIVEAAMKDNPKLASELAESIAPGKGTEWVIGFGRANPDFVVVDRGGTPLIRHAIETGAADPVGLWLRAGYNALDSGRDVRKIGGGGIRSKNARFDPAQSSSENILAGIAAGAFGAPAAYSTLRQD